MTSWDVHLFSLLIFCVVSWGTMFTSCEAHREILDEFPVYREQESPSLVKRVTPLPEVPLYAVKRSTIILDKLMYALQKALNKDPSFQNETDLQRRGPAGGKVYWRCYFNAVSCFRRK